MDKNLILSIIIIGVALTILIVLLAIVFKPTNKKSSKVISPKKKNNTFNKKQINKTKLIIKKNSKLTVAILNSWINDNIPYNSKTIKSLSQKEKAAILLKKTKEIKKRPY